MDFDHEGVGMRRLPHEHDSGFVFLEGSDQRRE